MRKKRKEILYGMELIENLLNGNIPDEKVEEVLEFLLWDNEWREVLHMEILLREYVRSRREWN
jgi:hypothetical protein